MESSHWQLSKTERGDVRNRYLSVLMPSSELQKRADDLRRQAESESLPSVRQQLLEAAEAWQAMATSRQRLECQKGGRLG